MKNLEMMDNKMLAKRRFDNNKTEINTDLS